jgi:hypothetical protein
LAHDHDHDDDDHSDDEIEITINPREEDLQALGVGLEEFEAALLKTLDSYEDSIDVEDPDSVAPLEETEISLGGKVVRLREVADIAITGGLDGLGDEDDEDEDEEDDHDHREVE